MVRHVVMWQFKLEAEGKSKDENMQIVKDMLYSLVSRISEIKRMEVGIDLTHSSASMDLMLLTEFDSIESLNIYAAHPEHLAVAKYVSKVVDSRIVLDCEI